jgi:hypothetical protein
MEDLSASLREYGVNLSKPEYFSDSENNMQDVTAKPSLPGPMTVGKATKTL